MCNIFVHDRVKSINNNHAIFEWVHVEITHDQCAVMPDMAFLF